MVERKVRWPSFFRSCFLSEKNSESDCRSKTNLPALVPAFTLRSGRAIEGERGWPTFFWDNFTFNQFYCSMKFDTKMPFHLFVSTGITGHHVIKIFLPSGWSIGEWKSSRLSSATSCLLTFTEIKHGGLLNMSR